MKTLLMSIASIGIATTVYAADDPFQGLHPQPVPPGASAPPPNRQPPVSNQNSRFPSSAVPDQPAALTKEERIEQIKLMRQALLRQPICALRPVETDEQIQQRFERRKSGQEATPNVPTFQEHIESLAGTTPCMDLEIRDLRLQQLQQMEIEEQK